LQNNNNSANTTCYENYLPEMLKALATSTISLFFNLQEKL